MAHLSHRLLDLRMVSDDPALQHGARSWHFRHPACKKTGSQAFTAADRHAVFLQHLNKFFHYIVSMTISFSWMK